MMSSAITKDKMSVPDVEQKSPGLSAYAVILLLLELSGEGSNGGNSIIGTSDFEHGVEVDEKDGMGEGDVKMSERLRMMGMVLEVEMRLGGLEMEMRLGGLEMVFSTHVDDTCVVKML